MTHSLGTGAEHRWFEDWFGKPPAASRRAHRDLLAAVFVTRGDGDEDRDILVCVRPYDSALEEVMDARIPDGCYGYYQMDLRGPDEPYREMPNIDVVHVVCDGGYDSEFGDTLNDMNPVEIFVDLEMARDFAREIPDRDTSIHSVRLDEMLPVPEPNTVATDAELRRFAARECIAPLAHNFSDFDGPPGSAVYSTLSPAAARISTLRGRRADRSRRLRGVLAFASFLRDPHDRPVDHRDPAPLFAVTRSMAKLVDLVEAELGRGQEPNLGWGQHYLQGPEMPYRTWPNINCVHVAFSGDSALLQEVLDEKSGILGVFVDRASATEVLTTRGQLNTQVVAVPLDAKMIGEQIG
jgi:hypothetical protein